MGDVEIDVDDEVEDWRVVVVDILVLMWVKNVVKWLVVKGWEVIILVEGVFEKVFLWFWGDDKLFDIYINDCDFVVISMFDFLKKGFNVIVVVVC